MRLRTYVHPDGTEACALFSDDEIYRYELLWRWSSAPVQVGWFLNPATADENALDDTLTKFRARTIEAGLGGIQVINLFAFRDKDPEAMKAYPEPVGPENDAVIRRVLGESKREGRTVVAGWGRHGAHRGRHAAALAMAAEAGVDLYCFDETSGKFPWHPGRLSYEKRPRLWKPAPARVTSS